MKVLIIGLTLALTTAACTVQAAHDGAARPPPAATTTTTYSTLATASTTTVDHAGRPIRDHHRLYALNGQAAALAARSGRRQARLKRYGGGLLRRLQRRARRQRDRLGLLRPGQQQFSNHTAARRHSGDRPKCEANSRLNSKGRQ